MRKLSRSTREYRETDSTNLEMHRLLEAEDMEEGTVVLADYQSRGKGYQGNAWLSQRGLNLLFSILLKPEFLDPGMMFHLGRIVSLALLEMLDNQGIKAFIKWPNDILAGSRKLCGILIENSIAGKRIRHSVIGIGLNVNQVDFDAGIPDPTSLCLEKGCHFDRVVLLGDFRSALEGWYRVLISEDTGRILKAYHERLYLKGQEALFSDGRKTFRGRIQRVLPGGELEVLEAGAGLRRFGFKEIRYLD